MIGFTISKLGNEKFKFFPEHLRIPNNATTANFKEYDWKIDVSLELNLP